MNKGILLIGTGASLVLCALSPTTAAAQGIAPPPPMDPNAQPLTPGQQDTHNQLREAESEDSGRGFELVWVNADLGGSYINLSQFSSTSLAVEKSTSGGPMFGVGAGLRFLFLSIGARARYNALSAFSMWQLNGELGVKIPISKLDLYFGAHGGWSWVGSLGDASIDTSSRANSGDVSVRGFNAGLELGADYFLTSLFSLGLGVNGDALFLKRPPVVIPANVPAAEAMAIAANPLYAQSGTSVGFGLGAALRVGLHFGL